MENKTKIGRPKLENSKDFMLRVRMNKEELKKLNEICLKEKLTMSEVVRKLIEDYPSN